MTVETAVTGIQILYPRIYMACHVDHVRAGSSPVRLSSRDSSILAHLTVDGLTTPSTLSRHLGISKATLSEAMAKLEALGYVRARRSREDERRQTLSLTKKGVDAMKRSSVLDASKLRSLLKTLSARERNSVINGLALLADAALK